VNRDQTGIETVFLTGDPSLSHVSSSLVRQVASLGGDISRYGPAAVLAVYGGKR
jgi:pantetheine-phosphate adenylyltransferase